MKRSILALFLAVLITLSFGITVFAEEPVLSPVDLKDCTVTLSKKEVTYTGKEIEPTVTVISNGVNLSKDKDFTVVYSNNINVGTATIQIAAVVGSTVCKGNISENFKILKMDISLIKNKVLSETDFVYSGKAKIPSLSVYGDRYSPVNKTDYTVTYKNNVNTGVATAVCTGTGNYSGSFSKKFYIHPQKITGLKQSETQTNSLKLSWNYVGGKVTSYRVYKYDSKKKTYKTITNTKNNYYTINKLSSGSNYSYAVRAFKNSEGKNIYGEFSAIEKTTTKPAQVFTHDSSFKGKYFIVKWSKIASNGYEIQYTTDKNFKKSVKKATVSSKNSEKKIKISKNKTYYYRVRAYKEVSKKKYYGSWSSKKTTYFSNTYSTYTTYFNSPAGRTTNIKLAAKFINGTVLKPGDTFSFNKIVGQRTPERGFQLAPVFSGQDHLMGYGGGVCQVSSTIFNAALLANLQIVERSQHSMKVTYVPAGRDAAISWGTQDMKFKNNTDYEIKISCKVYNSSKLVVKLLTNSISSPKKVTLKVSQSGKKYTLKRYVSGKNNYTTYSTY